ncbi:MAG: MaoC/PaaZ C-terminal domain-containing protein [Acidimicrobiia bacterium]|nr:MaoC/PaaZ C-terminal domain-containing protein [Acidimicrobiia bacterium]
MPIDVDRVAGADLPATRHSWDVDDVILYHLGVGAGDPPTDPGELAYVYEGSLKVLPTFATVPMFASMMGILNLEGLDVNPAMILHGEQSVRLHRPIPAAASVVNHGRVTEVYDKGKGAVAVVEISTVTESGEELFTNTAAIYVRGEGGFGGDPGPEPAHRPPQREPDAEFSSTTLPQQALLYRLSGDKNPLHADPAFAAFGGFDRPILHGLCTYGVVCKAVVDHLLDGDVTAVAGFDARFSGVVFPGETIVTRAWRADGAILVEARTSERDQTVLANAAVLLTG